METKVLGHRSTTTNCPDCPKDSHLMQFIEMIRNWNPENASWNCSKDAQWCTYSERPAACKACVKYKSCQSSEWNNGKTTNHAKNMKHCLDGKACIQCSKRAEKNRRKTCRLPLTNSSQEPKQTSDCWRCPTLESNPSLGSILAYITTSGSTFFSPRCQPSLTLMFLEWTYQPADLPCFCPEWRSSDHFQSLSVIRNQGQR